MDHTTVWQNFASASLAKRLQMPVLTFPSETADRLQERIARFGKNHRVKLFPATDVALGLVFTLDEIKEFGG